MPKTYKPSGNQIGSNFTGMKIKRERPKEDQKDENLGWILSQQQDDLGASTHYKANDLETDGYYVHFTRIANKVSMWPVTKKTIFRQLDKPIADAEININKTLTMMKRRKGKKKLKPTKAELDEKAEKDSLSDLVNKQSGDEWNDGESVEFGGDGGRDLKEKDAETLAKEEFKDMDLMVKRAAPDMNDQEDDFTDEDSDEDDVSDYSK